MNRPLQCKSLTEHSSCQKIYFCMSSSPHVARSCPELASFGALHESQLPLWDLHLLWCAVLNGMRHCGFLWALWVRKWGISALEPGTAPPSLFSSDLGVCRVISLSQVLLSVFYIFLNRLSQRCHQSHWWAQLWAVAGLTRSLLMLALSDLGITPGVLPEANLQHTLAT